MVIQNIIQNMCDYLLSMYIGMLVLAIKFLETCPFTNAQKKTGNNSMNLIMKHKNNSNSLKNCLSKVLKKIL